MICIYQALPATLYTSACPAVTFLAAVAQVLGRLNVSSSVTCNSCCSTFSCLKGDCRPPFQLPLDPAVVAAVEPHLLSCIPPEDLPALLLVHTDMTVELDGVTHYQTLNLPRVAKGQPVVRLLMLESVYYTLHREGCRTADTASNSANM